MKLLIDEFKSPLEDTYAPVPTITVAAYYSAFEACQLLHARYTIYNDSVKRTQPYMPTEEQMFMQ